MKIYLHFTSEFLSSVWILFLERISLALSASWKLNWSKYWNIRYSIENKFMFVKNYIEKALKLLQPDARGLSLKVTEEAI